MPSRRSVLLSLPLLGARSLAPAQAGIVPKRIGILSVRAAPGADEGWENDFLIAMKKKGWHVGANLSVERAYVGWRLDRLPPLVAELIRKRVDVIIINGDDLAVGVAARMSKTIPVVFNQAFAPVEQGFVDSLAHPGRNLTGTTVFSGPEFLTKRLEFLRALSPSTRRLAWLYGGTTLSLEVVNGGTFEVGTLIQSAARDVGFETHVYLIREPEDVPRALAAATAWGAQAISAGGNAVYAALGNLIAYALRARLPTAFSVRDYAEAGGLFSYGVPNDEYSALGDRWVDQIDRILRGANPSTIPVELPRKFELCINAKTAKAIGLVVPGAVLARADKVIE